MAVLQNFEKESEFLIFHLPQKQISLKKRKLKSSRNKDLPQFMVNIPPFHLSQIPLRFFTQSEIRQIFYTQVRPITLSF